MPYRLFPLISPFKMLRIYDINIFVLCTTNTIERFKTKIIYYYGEANKQEVSTHLAKKLAVLMSLNLSI